MAGKIGESFFHEKLDRGFREIGGFFYGDSNIAQPMYQLRGNYGPAKEMDGPEPSDPEPAREEPLPVEPPRDEPGKNDPGLERD